MDQQRERIQADLRGLLRGEVRCDDAFAQLYASDGSIYEVKPLGVVRPSGPADLIAAVRYAADAALPLHARGAGTGLAGEALGPGLVLDFSHAMRRIVEVTGERVVVQPGVVLGQLNRYLRAFGRRFGPDPAVGGVTTVGGVTALDSSGSNWLRYGSARDHVLSLQIVLASGETFTAAQHPVTDNSDLDPLPRRRELVRRLAELIQREETVIAAHRPQALVNRCGYHLYDVLKDGVLDLARLLVGSEGTLALTTEATLRTTPIPPHRGLALVFFDRLETAAQAAVDARELRLSVCDLMDRRILSLARDVDPRYAQAIPREAEALLLIEQLGATAEEVQDSLQQAVVRWRLRRRLAFGSQLILAPDEYDLFRRLARRVSPTLHRVRGPDRPTPFVEDIAVPPDRLPEFLAAMHQSLRSRQVTASFFAHAGHGQLHIRPFLNLRDPSHLQLMPELASDLYEQAVALGGTMAGEHGCGLSRTWFMRRQFGPLYDVFREVKRIFDPDNLLNPGKVVADVPQPLVKNLRRSLTGAGDEPVAEAAAVLAEERAAAESPSLTTPKPPLELHLVWTESVTDAADGCNGCGRCRTQSPESRMCPVFRVAPAEEASPRAKANLLRAMTTGQMSPAALERAEIKALADLCFNCHQCRLECPAAVDVPKLVLEAKSQYVAANGLDAADWWLARLDWAAQWGQRFRSLANWALRTRWTRWLLERATGLAQGRKLPQLAPRSFLREAERRGLGRPVRGGGDKVLYFLDSYATYFDWELAEALLAICRRHAIAVYIPPGQQPSGMPRISLGDIEGARPQMVRNTSLLADAVRQGYEIVCTEPTAASCLKHEYPRILGDDDSRLVAAHVHDACDYLWKRHQVGKLELDLRPVNLTLGYHEPCHTRSLELESPGARLLSLIPGLEVKKIDRGCSGMAGAFGLAKKNYRTSLRIGWGLISGLRNSAVDLGTTECSACKMQMEQAVEKATVHPLKMLALSYGLLSGGERLLVARGQELVVT